MFECYFTVFSESRLWECRVFSLKNARTSQMSHVFPFTFHLFLLLEALQGFWRLCEALRGIAENHLWECRIFSFKNARTQHKSRVFPLTFHLFLLP